MFHQHRFHSMRTTASSRPAAPLCVDVLPYDDEVCHLAGEHPVENRLTSEQRRRVRTPHPFVGRLLVGE